LGFTGADESNEIDSEQSDSFDVEELVQRVNKDLCLAEILHMYYNIEN
jgi:hypothetical protein